MGPVTSPVCLVLSPATVAPQVSLREAVAPPTVVRLGQQHREAGDGPERLAGALAGTGLTGPGSSCSGCVLIMHTGYAFTRSAEGAAWMAKGCASTQEEWAQEQEVCLLLE